MAFFEQQFDPRLSFGARGGPVWSTSVARVQSGRRYANRNWSAPLHRYNVGHAIKDETDFDIVRSFFYVVSGAYDGFRFKDWSDYRATQANSYLTQQSGSPGEWQLQRAYTVGSRTYLRDIFKPIAGLTVRRYRSGNWSDASDAQVDTTDGTVHLPSHAGGDTYAWIGEFDVPVAFVEDSMEAEIVDNGGEFLMQWPSITVEEIRL